MSTLVLSVNIKHRHDNRKAVGKQVGGYKGLEDPLEDVERIKIVHVILFSNHSNQLITQDKSDDNSRYRNHDIIGKIFYHGKDAGVPCLWSLSNFCSNGSDFGIYIVKQGGQIA